MPVIDHMQIADVPARNEPGTGEIGWEYVFRRIDELGYMGWVGCEYRPPAIRSRGWVGGRSSGFEGAGSWKVWALTEGAIREGRRTWGQTLDLTHPGKPRIGCDS